MIAGFKLAMVALVAAYVLPSYSILRRMADGRDDLALSALKVEGSAAVSPSSAREISTLLGVEWQSGELMLTFSASIRFPGRCRLELASTESTKSLVAVWSNGKRRSEGGELPALQVAVGEICALLALRGSAEGESRAEVEQHLASRKINSRATSLGRFRGTIAYVLGETAPGAAQFWIFKDHFNPARVRFLDEKQVGWDVHFFDYTSQATGKAFPRQVLVNKGAEPVLRLTTLRSAVKPKLEDALF